MASRRRPEGGVFLTTKISSGWLSLSLFNLFARTQLRKSSESHSVRHDCVAKDIARIDIALPVCWAAGGRCPQR